MAPGEHTWRAIDAKGYMVIHCLWVVGKYKGNGFGQALLEHAIKEAEGYKGIAVVASTSPWLTSPKIFLKNNFKLVETFNDNIGLYVKKNDPKAENPQFIRHEPPNNQNGITVYKSPQCPYTSNMTVWIENFAQNKGIKVSTIQITNAKQAQQGNHPYGTFYALYDTKLLTYESNPKTFVKSFDILSDN